MRVFEKDFSALQRSCEASRKSVGYPNAFAETDTAHTRIGRTEDRPIKDEENHNAFLWWKKGSSWRFGILCSKFMIRSGTWLLVFL